MRNAEREISISVVTECHFRMFGPRHSSLRIAHSRFVPLRAVGVTTMHGRDRIPSSN